MRRLKLVLGVVALLVAIMAASAVTASADDNDDEDCFIVDGVLIGDCDDDDFCDHHDCDREDICDLLDIDDEDCFDFDRDNDLFDVGDVSQDLEQDADSGDIDQDFSVTSTGDNSNQCVGTQGVANTGNVQNAGSFDLLGGDFDDLEIDDDSGASIDVDGSSDTSCDEEVNQAASASG